VSSLLQSFKPSSTEELKKERENSIKRVECILKFWKVFDRIV